ncbi:hypothetical protein VZT92_027579 [Zoarces viviparus]|uniref:Uncharacterized protein n=1 Tax=Zoarces viviparus TaxID=48416 RepID=A0AAW1DVY8_ZOAVI
MAPAGGGCYEPPFLRNCAQTPEACVKLIRYHRLYGCSAAPLQWPGRRGTALLESMITLFSRQMDAEIGTRLWTRVKAPPRSAGALYGRVGGVFTC